MSDTRGSRRRGEGAPTPARRPDPATFAPGGVQEMAARGWQRTFDEWSYAPVTGERSVPEAWTIPVETRFTRPPVVPTPRVRTRPRWLPGFIRNGLDALFWPPDRQTPAQQEAEWAEHRSRLEGAVWGFRTTIAGQGERDATWESLRKATEYLSGAEIEYPQVTCWLCQGPEADPMAPMAAASGDAGLAECLRHRSFGLALVPAALAEWFVIKALLLQCMRGAPWPEVSPSSDQADLERAISERLPLIDDLLVLLMFAKWLNGMLLAPAPEFEREWALAWAGIEVSNLNLENATNAFGNRLKTMFFSKVILRDRPLAEPRTCKDVLHTALWANLGAQSFAEVLDAAVSLGGDTMACAAAACAIAGARFGKVGIPQNLLARVTDPERTAALVEMVADRMFPPLAEE